MKIALVSPYDYYTPGGVSQHMSQLRTEFLRLGHEVVVIAPRSTKGGVHVERGVYGIGRTVSIPANGARARVTFDVTLYADVKELMRRERFDVVHLHEPLVPVLPYMVLLNSQSVNVATFHAFRASNPWYTAFKPYMSFVLSRLDGRIAVSEPAREFVSQYFEGPYDVVPNGIDVEHFRSRAIPLPWAHDGTPRILFVGRFDEQRKGFKYLLQAMPLIQQQFPNARLVVVGQGKRQRFEGLMERHEISSVDYVGYVSGDELPRYYASCDLFCAPSIHGESFGLVLLEAMAAGAPVVASNIAGYASVVRHGKDGVLVPPRDPQALALALVRLLADREYRQAMIAAGAKAVEGFAWPAIATQVLRVYDKAARAAAVADWRRG